MKLVSSKVEVTNDIKNRMEYMFLLICRYYLGGHGRSAKGGRKILHYCKLETTMMEVFVQND
jgi:hypothetical protein